MVFIRHKKTLTKEILPVLYQRRETQVVQGGPRTCDSSDVINVANRPHYRADSMETELSSVRPLNYMRKQAAVF